MGPGLIFTLFLVKRVVQKLASCVIFIMITKVKIAQRQKFAHSGHPVGKIKLCSRQTNKMRQFFKGNFAEKERPYALPNVTTEQVNRSSKTKLKFASCGAGGGAERGGGS
jgi:hypothetical protein